LTAFVLGLEGAIQAVDILFFAGTTAITAKNSR
jgi:hypothetical protein